MATERKFIVYLNDSKNIILTDKDISEDVIDVKDKLIKLMGSKKICVLQTQDDMLLCRPNRIDAILVSSKGGFSKAKELVDIEESDEDDDTLFELEDIDEESYDKTLKFEEKDDN